jgi:hypothetical protein
LGGDALASWTQQDLDNIEKMIASGITSARFGDRQYTYASITDLLRVRDLIKTSLAPSKPNPNRYASFDSGIK